MKMSKNTFNELLSGALGSYNWKSVLNLTVRNLDVGKCNIK